MNRIQYLLEISVKNIRRYRLTSVVRFLGFFLCFFVTLLYAGIFEGSNRRINSIGHIKDIDNLNMYAAYSEEKIPDGFSHYSFYAMQGMVFYEDEYISDAGLRIIDPGYSDIFEDFFLEGDKITNPESQCIVGKRIRDKFNIAIGEHIVIGDHTFEVCGITDDNLYSKNILLCDSSVVEIGYPGLFFYDSEVPDNLLGDGNLYVHKEIEDYLKMADSETTVLTEMVTVSIAVVLFSLVSIYSIFLFYMEKRSIAINVLYCVGVPKTLAFSQHFIENFMISGMAAVVAFILLKGMEIPLGKLELYDFAFPFYSLALALFFAFVISLLLSGRNVTKSK